MVDRVKRVADSPTSLREHFAFLPLQISHFDRLCEVPACLDLESSVADGELRASMDDDGCLVIDTDQMRLLRHAFKTRLTAKYLDEIRDLHAERLAALHDEIDGLSMELAEFQTRELLEKIGRVGDLIAALAPYGLVTKIVPDVLRCTIKERLGENEKVISDRSWSALLHPEHASAPDLAFHLVRAWRNILDISATDGSRVARIDQQLQDDWAGMGPHAWEAPGYETPSYLLKLLAEQFGRYPADRLAKLQELHLKRRSERLAMQRDLDASLGSPEMDGALVRFVEHFRYWAAYIDDQTATLRRSFYRGLLPLLQPASQLFVREAALERRSDILFLTRHEIRSGPCPEWPAIIHARRERYAQNLQRAEALVGTNRLEQLTDGTWSQASDISSHDDGGDRAKPTFAGATAADSVGLDRSEPQQLSGLSAAAAHTVTGPAHRVSSLDDMQTVPEGAIVVTRLITPDMAPMFWRIAGVIVEESGLTQHASILAREFELPCVVGVKNASDQIITGDRIELCGATGTVTVGGSVQPQDTAEPS